MHENARSISDDLEQQSCQDREHKSPCLVIDPLRDLSKELGREESYDCSVGRNIGIVFKVRELRAWKHCRHCACVTASLFQSVKPWLTCNEPQGRKGIDDVLSSCYRRRLHACRESTYSWIVVWLAEDTKVKYALYLNNKGSDFQNER